MATAVPALCGQEQEGPGSSRTALSKVIDEISLACVVKFQASERAFLKQKVEGRPETWLSG